jgi:hypothetical protein
MCGLTGRSRESLVMRNPRVEETRLDEPVKSVEKNEKDKIGHDTCWHSPASKHTNVYDIFPQHLHTTYHADADSDSADSITASHICSIDLQYSILASARSANILTVSACECRSCESAPKRGSAAVWWRCDTRAPTWTRSKQHAGIKPIVPNRIHTKQRCTGVLSAVERLYIRSSGRRADGLQRVSAPSRPFSCQLTNKTKQPKISTLETLVTQKEHWRRWGRRCFG